MVAIETVWGKVLQAVPIVKFMLLWRATAGQKNSVICRPGTAPAGACRGKQDGGASGVNWSHLEVFLLASIDRKRGAASIAFSLASSLHRPLPSRGVWKTNKGSGTVFDLWIVVQERKIKLPLVRLFPTMPFLSGSEPDEPYFPRLVQKVVKVPRQARKAASSIVSGRLISLAARYL